MCCSNCTTLALGSSFMDSCVPLIYPLTVKFVDYFLTFCHYKMLQAPLMYFLPQSWNQPLLPEPWFLSQENGIRSQNLSTKCYCYWCIIVSRPFQPTEKEIHVCVLTHIYTLTYKYFYIQSYVSIVS